MSCPTCGAPAVPGNDFCTQCGSRLAVARPAESPRTGQTAASRQPAATTTVLAAPVGTNLEGPPQVPSALSDLIADQPREASLPGDDGPRQAGRPPFKPPPATNELLGQAAPNTVYLGQRLMYEKEAQLEELDPLRSGRYIGEMFRRGLLVWAIWAVGLIPIAIVGVILGVINHSFGSAIGALLIVVWSIITACLFWFHKLPGQISEWKFTVDDQGEAAYVAFDHIGWSFDRRNTPVDSIRVRRFNILAQGSRDLLEVRQGIFYGLTSCFANGNDLYIGWTFWLYLSPARFFWIGIRRFIWELRFRGHAIYVSLQFDQAKALRESIHSAVREGVDVAAGQRMAQGQGTIGTVIPVVADNSVDIRDWREVAPGGVGR